MTTTNSYAKFAPNVYVAKCPEAHAKGDCIILTSKYGNETEVEIHNLVKQQDGFFFYSFVRCDGSNSQTRAAMKAERYQGYAHKRALELNAAALILAHNHPSGQVTPSQSDRNITTKIKDAAALFDIRLLDHIIVGGTTTYSFVENLDL